MTFLINSNKASIFLSILFSQCKVSLYETNKHEVGSLLVLVKIVVASQHKRQRNKSLSRFSGI